MRRLLYFGALTAAFALTASCHGTLPFVQQTIPAGSMGPAGILPAKGSGGVSLTIRWPQRTLQAIPASTTQIVVEAFTVGSSTPLLSQTANRPSEQTSSTITLQPLPAGAIVLSTTAKDSSGKALAAGSVTLSIVSNQIVSAKITMLPTDRPAITGFAPANAVPGHMVTLNGSGFGESEALSYSVSLGGVAATPTYRSDSVIQVRIPDTATNSAFIVTVGGNATQSVNVFTTIRALAMSTTSVETFAPHAVVQFQATARDYASNLVFDPTLSWALENAPSGFGSIDPSTGRFIGYDAVGEAQVAVGTGSVVARATLKTHALVPSDLPSGMGPLPILSANADKAALGKALFFEEGLSSTGKMSCATCHLPSKGWSDGLAQAKGNDGSTLKRSSPTVLNIAHLTKNFFWDGRAATLEDQIQGVFDSGKELNATASESAIVNYLKNTGTYAASFSAVYGSMPDPVTLANARNSIAEFEKTVVTGESGFDRWAKNTGTLSDSAKRGLGFFIGKGQCASCHSGPAFTDGEFHDIGVPDAPGVTDEGRKEATGVAADARKFRTPPLRNVTETAPFFHNGIAAGGIAADNLTKAIHHYETVSNQAGLDPKLARGLIILPQENADLVEFLKALSGATPSVQ